MYVFNEGVPRSGKSYDAVLTHLLAALSVGRKVYARINGLNFEAIAVYLGVSVEYVSSLLRVVTNAEVRTLFVARQDAHGGWYIDDELKDALFIIDECHEFYVASRNAIDPAIEQFFALCGQNGMDGVLMSQWYKRLHSSVRARVERKNVFQKLTAVGMTGRYLVKRYHATEPDRFELVDTQTLSYDKAIFPLYAGYAPGADNVAVYKAGGSTVWQRLAKYAWIVVPLFVIGVWYFVKFLHSDGTQLLKQRPAQHVAQPAQGVRPLATTPLPVRQVVGVQDKYSLKGMSPEVKYVFDLCNHARARLAGVVQREGRDALGVIEWQGDQGAVTDRMSFDQLRALGVGLEVHPYGVKLVWHDQAVIVTPWPLDAAAQASSGSQAPVVSPANGVPPVEAGSQTVASSAGASGWRASAMPMRSDYVPPELETRPVYAPHVLQ